MKKYRNIALMGLTALLTATSCQDLLTEKPDSYYEEKNFFINVENASLSVIGIYNAFTSTNHYGQVEMAMPTSDDMYFINGTTTDNTRRDISHYSISTTNDWVRLLWINKYKSLERANYTLKGIEGMDLFKTGDSDLKKVWAEAKFLRAFISYDLIKYWGDVPYKTEITTTYEEAYQPRTNREEIYDQIIADLNDAIAFLPWAGGTSSAERASQGAARGLMMRVLLQRSGYSLQMNGTMTRPEEGLRQEYLKGVLAQWEKFETEGTHDFFAGGYRSYFEQNSKCIANTQESLFEMAFYTPDGKTGATGNWGTYNGPLVAAPSVAPTETGSVMGRANAFFRVLPAWKGFYEETDERRDANIVTYQYKWDKNKKQHVKFENKASSGWFPGKWRREWMDVGFKDPNNTDVNYCVLRYADVVLMAAEAYNETNNSAKAWELINEVRTRSHATAVDASNYATHYKAPKVYDLPFIADGDEQGKVRTALYWERGFELAYEGTRKLDLIRWNVLGDAIKLAYDNDSFGYTSNVGKEKFPAGRTFQKGKHELFPIPLDEIQLNYKLEGMNNPGY